MSTQAANGAASRDHMDRFYKDSLRFGCLKNFKHFSLYLRGREELLVTVFHENSASAETPVEVVHSATFGQASQHLPPASPATREVSVDDPKETVFLVGAYARYNWPYVWLRSNLGKFVGSSGDQDLPLDLRTTQKFKEDGYRVWDIVEELVQMNVTPAPENPFEVDLKAFERMAALDRTLLSGAMAFFLRDLVLTDAPYVEAVKQDLLKMLEMHFKGVPTMFSDKKR